MQFKTVALTLFASFVAAQDLSLLPDCARPCFVDNFPISGCTSETDYACLCASSAYNQAVTSCVLGACSTTDALAALDWATTTCNSVGVPIEL